jgi:hypothetical protein
MRNFNSNRQPFRLSKNHDRFDVLQSRALSIRSFMPSSRFGFFPKISTTVENTVEKRAELIKTGKLPRLS